MRLVITATALALVALWAVAMPLASQVTTRTPPAMSTALFLCRTQQGIDQNCAAALAKALTLEQSKRDATATADRTCRAEPRTLPERRGTRP
jgi:hypothetical protein